MDDRTAEDIYSGAIARISRLSIVFGVLFCALAFLLYGWPAGVGFGVGAVLAWWNFQALGRAVQGLATRIVDSGSRESGKRLVLRFLIRYVLVGVAGYGIFKLSRTSLIGLLAGLCVPVAAVGCEAVYELYIALRRGV